MSHAHTTPSIPLSIPSAVEVPEYAFTVADAIDRFGALPIRRIRGEPAPGSATEDDLVRINEAGERLCELIDGVLLEKTVGTYESLLATRIAAILERFVSDKNLGVVLGGDAMLRLWADQVRLPDVSFISWDRLPGGTIPDEAVWGVVPDLAVEVISRGNTREEMDRKLRDYFEAGVRAVWYVLPASREVRVFTAIDRATTFGPGATLDGAPVLPGLTIALDQLFTKPTAP